MDFIRITADGQTLMQLQTGGCVYFPIYSLLYSIRNSILILVARLMHVEVDVVVEGVVPVDAVEVVPVVGDVVAVGVGVLGVEVPHNVIVVDVEGVELDEGVIPVGEW